MSTRQELDMRIKLQAIWKIITSHYFLVVTSSGGLVSTMPKDLKTLQCMQAFINAFTSKKD